ncbi:MAG: nucleoside phosphorylase [Desulfobacterales bacterium]|nr:nucleoside phosphorylase [Desulfobacterales bacterium]
MDEAVIQPNAVLDLHLTSDTAIMVSTQLDLMSIVGHLGFSKSQFQPIFHSRLYKNNHITLVGPYMGAPYAVTLLEILIAQGVQKVVVVGWCGAIHQDIQIGDIIIPNQAIIEEGTSQHYIGKQTASVSCHSHLKELITHTLHENKIQFHEGCIWTTDAIFRETHEKIIQFQQHNVLAVEMELSALFTIAIYRHIELASILFVSDLVASLKWEKGFKDQRFHNTRSTVFLKIAEFFNQ